MERLIPLCQLPQGKTGCVQRMEHTGLTRRRLFDLGLIAGTAVECCLKSPTGSPTA